MKIGIILECGPIGADLQVIVNLAKRLRPGIEISSATLDNKPNLVRECGIVAASLISDGCERVVIIWDLYPAWRVRGQKPCRKEDREDIFTSLKDAGVNPDHVGLVCIEEELEAWLIADERALSSTIHDYIAPHTARIRKVKHPERQSNPKKFINRVFQQNTGRPYTDRDHAIKIINHLQDFQRLRACPTFVRFEQIISNADL